MRHSGTMADRRVAPCVTRRPRGRRRWQGCEGPRFHPLPRNTVRGDELAGGKCLDEMLQQRLSPGIPDLRRARSLRSRLVPTRSGFSGLRITITPIAAVVGARSGPAPSSMPGCRNRRRSPRRDGPAGKSGTHEAARDARASSIWRTPRRACKCGRRNPVFVALDQTRRCCRRRRRRRLASCPIGEYGRTAIWEIRTPENGTRNDSSRHASLARRKLFFWGRCLGRLVVGALPASEIRKAVAGTLSRSAASCAQQARRRFSGGSDRCRPCRCAECAMAIRASACSTISGVDVGVQARGDTSGRSLPIASRTRGQGFSSP